MLLGPRKNAPAQDGVNRVCVKRGGVLLFFQFFPHVPGQDTTNPSLPTLARRVNGDPGGRASDLGTVLSEEGIITVLESDNVLIIIKLPFSYPVRAEPFCLSSFRISDISFAWVWIRERVMRRTVQEGVLRVVITISPVAR